MVPGVNHEITPREPHNGYLILQGGLPDVEAFVKQHWNIGTGFPTFQNRAMRRPVRRPRAKAPPHE